MNRGGRLTELLTAAQMRAVERDAIDSGAVTGLELMECAGAGVVETVFAEWPELTTGGHRAVVLCGPGNNGGDGFVVARLLQARGWEVAVWALSSPGAASADAAAELEAWQETGGPVQPWSAIAGRHAPDLVVDAVFGTGLTRAVPQELSEIFRHVREDWHDGAREQGRRMRRVAVDIPSGVSSDAGTILRREGAARSETGDGPPGDVDGAFQADLTVTFHAPKLGHYLGSGARVCGKTACIALPHVARCDAPFDQDVSHDGHVRLIEPVLEGRHRPPAEHFRELHKAHGHKYDNGHALILSGGAGRTGAARLAARGALRIGAGLVTLGVPGSAQMECAAQLTAVMLRRAEDGAQLARLLEDVRLNALCLGPGLGAARARALVPAALRGGGPHGRPARGVVLDADALTAFAPETLFGMVHGACVLTPHGGEFAGLFPDIADALDAAGGSDVVSKVDATRKAAQRAGCVVLFKGPDTVIADPLGRCSVNAAVYERAAPWLATAGSGDVLAGMICGLMARGVPAMRAAEIAAWVHVEAARRGGPGLIAEDLPEQLPGLFRSMGV
jgi:hydroxyethylthiazole kinase-like uncharacterized protein yjeF